jgi:hypothetical protein
MNNTDEIDFWIFGQARIPKLTILGSMFGTGLLLGFLVGRPHKKSINTANTNISPEEDQQVTNKENKDYLSDEDRDYIK